jgi:hypothetical protein
MSRQRKSITNSNDKLLLTVKNGRLSRISESNDSSSYSNNYKTTIRRSSIYSLVSKKEKNEEELNCINKLKYLNDSTIEPTEENLRVRARAKKLMAKKKINLTFNGKEVDCKSRSVSPISIDNNKIRVKTPKVFNYFSKGQRTRTIQQSNNNKNDDLFIDRFETSTKLGNNHRNNKNSITDSQIFLLNLKNESILTSSFKSDYSKHLISTSKISSNKTSGNNEKNIFSLSFINNNSTKGLLKSNKNNILCQDSSHFISTTIKSSSRLLE